MAARLTRVDIFESERVFRKLSRVRIPPDPEVIVLGHPGEKMGDVTAHRVIAIDVVARFAQERQRVKVRPPFPHSPGLKRGNAQAATHSAGT